MKKDEILEILIDWNFWEKEQDVGKLRENLINNLEDLLKINEVITITGVRRCGKSTALYQFCKGLIDKGCNKKDILIVNIEDPRFRNPSIELLENICGTYIEELQPSKRHYVILDEIQIVNGWEKFVRFLHENKKVSVFVTGSTSKLMSQDYSSVMTGRHVDYTTYPLSFREYLSFKDVEINTKIKILANKHKIISLLKEYIEFGGFPKVALLDKNEKNKLLNAYFEDIITKDVLLKHRIAEKEVLVELSKYYLSNMASIHSFNKLKNIFGVSLDTVQRFSEYLSDAYVLFFVKKFSYKVKEQILNPKKVYCIDAGLRNAVCFRFSEDIGKLYENVVFLELKRKGKEIYYWKDAQQREVDFVIKEGLVVKELIQVCLNLENEKTKKRETDALLIALDEFEINEGTIITEDYENEENFDGKIIKFIPLWKWLLWS